MRPITKWSLGLLALVGLAQAALVALLAWPGLGWLHIADAFTEPFRWVLVGLSAVVGLTFLVMLLIAIFRRSTSRDLSVETRRGELKFSRAAIENALSQAVVATHPVRDVAVDVAIQGKNPKAKVDLDAYSLGDGELVQAGREIEKTTRAKIAEMLGIPVKKLKVTVHPPGNEPRGTARVV